MRKPRPREPTQSSHPHSCLCIECKNDTTRTTISPIITAHPREPSRSIHLHSCLCIEYTHDNTRTTLSAIRRYRPRESSRSIYHHSCLCIKYKHDTTRTTLAPMITPRPREPTRSIHPLSAPLSLSLKLLSSLARFLALLHSLSYENGPPARAHSINSS